MKQLIADALEVFELPKDVSESEMVARLFKMYQNLTVKAD